MVDNPSDGLGTGDLDGLFAAGRRVVFLDGDIGFGDLESKCLLGFDG